MIRSISMSLGLAFLTAVATSAAEPVTRVTDYDNVHIRVLDPEKAAAWYVSALGATPSVDRTECGAFLGTVGYAAPEQLQPDQPVDRARGSPLGSRLEPAPEQDQADDDGR